MADLFRGITKKVVISKMERTTEKLVRGLKDGNK